MKIKKNAFTLIELLAVIVILAIIALIATPIILGIINDAKDQANERSAEMYLKAINNSIVSLAIDNKKINDGTYDILENGNICLGVLVDNVCNGDVLEVEIDGNFSTGGTIKITNGSVANGTTITIGETSYEIVSNELKKVTAEGPEHLAKDNVRAVTESKTGIVPIQDSNGNIRPGSEFKIKVSDKILDEKGNIAEYTFFVLSNEGDYVNLIAEQNITPDGKFTREKQAKDSWYTTSSYSYDNRYGPQTVYTYLGTATNNWTNIPIIENFDYDDEGHKEDSNYGYQSIVTDLDETTGKYITTITPYSSDYGNPVTYENMRARLPYVSEVTENTTCKVYSSWIDYGLCPLWMVNYLYSNGYYTSEQKVNSTGYNYGYWLLSSNPGSSSNARYVNHSGYVGGVSTYDGCYGLRPVITVLKSDLLRVMK